MRRICFIFLIICLMTYFSFASDYSELMAYDMIADGNCRSAIKLIKDESMQLSFRLSSEKKEKGQHILSNLKYACEGLQTAEKYFETIEKCTDAYCIENRDVIKLGHCRINEKHLAVSEFSPKLKNKIKVINENCDKYKEIAEWKKNGFYDQKEIDLFVKNKILVDSAMNWRAGTWDKRIYGEKQQFSAEEMVEWFGGGFDRYLARRFKNANISYKEIKEKKNRLDFFKDSKYSQHLVEWITCPVEDENLFKWSTLSESCDDVKLWLSQKAEYEEAQKWIQICTNASLALSCMKSGISYEDLKKWDGAGMTLDEIKGWLNSNISAEDAVKWKKLNKTPEDAFEWKKYGFSLDNEDDVLWFSAEIDITPKDAQKWKENGFASYECWFFRKFNYTLQQAVSIYKTVRQKCKFSSNKKMKELLKNIDRVADENPYDTKGKCYIGQLSFSHLKNKKEAYFTNKEGAVIHVKTKESVPVNCSVFGYYYSNGVTSFKNPFGVESIVPSFDAIFIEKF